MNKRAIRYSLGFNFDPSLIKGIIEANEKYGGDSRIDEVFGALPDSPISSARPTSRIPALSWKKFTEQIQCLREAGIAFNFLMNTAQTLDSVLTANTIAYFKRLADAGVNRLTVGTPELCAVAKAFSKYFHVTISITYGIHSRQKLMEAEATGADAAYLDGVYVNRDFDLLRTLLKRANVECRLYANMSCLSHCQVVGKHYSMFSGAQNASIARRNDAFFAGCSLVKLRNPTEWLQMPWIRPEDVGAYASEGVSHFKLADRLAPTPVLLTIAKSYLKKQSPDNLFDLMERDGSKYKFVSRDSASYREPGPLYIHSKILPADFIDHFRADGCKSNDLNCKFCIELTKKAVKVNEDLRSQLPAKIRPLVPLALKKRAGYRN